MNGQPAERILLALPDHLDDAALVALVEFFYDAARIIENHYAGQLSRYYQQVDQRQQSLWEDDPPF